MNYTKARCGHDVPAEGSPGSMARRACEQRTCSQPRCESGLPKKFTGRECAAYVWLKHRGIHEWSVDYADKKAMDHKHDREHLDLLALAFWYGWNG